MHPGGVPGTTAETIAIWAMLNGNMVAAEAGWKHAARMSDLRLTREGMTALALAKWDSNDRILRARCPDWDTFPACARMALHSLAWACGANAHYPRMFADVNARDFDAAAVEIHINEYTPEGIHNVGVIPRNVANKILMRNAQRVDAFHLDPDFLDWTHDLSVSDNPTLPDLSAITAEYDAEPVVHIEEVAGDYLSPDLEPKD
jgi:GH24 family phage-related lysozyme (muramidase)